MSWRESSGRECCNRCRVDVQLGAPIYVGELTPSFWCETCADQVLGQRLDGQPCPKVRSVGDLDAFNPKVMGAKLREAILARRRGMHVVERI